VSDLSDLLDSIYGKNDLGRHPFFTGEFINFGYWKDINLKAAISADVRSNASRALYAHLLDALDLSTADQVCEIGIGHGVGLRMALEDYHVEFAHGIDLHQEQVERAGQLLEKSQLEASRFHLARASAASTGLAESSVTKLFSVEAAHHFPSMIEFANEVRRVLKPGGALGISTLFPVSSAALKRLPDEVPDLDLVLHPMLPIDQVNDCFTSCGLSVERLESIGQEVFPGFQKWVDQTKVQESWGSIWLEAFEKKLIDYYLLVFRKP
jgi:cyclopropane fatty-acyl-phospholipid synthase-like methyltransferase